MNKELKELLKKPMLEWTDKDIALYDKYRKKKYDLKTLMRVAQEDWGEEESEGLDSIKSNLPKNVIKLPKDEGMISPGQNAKPFVYMVKKGDTLKSISENFCISYGELSNHLMSIQGSTGIKEGDEIRIPRYFIDLSKA